MNSKKNFFNNFFFLIYGFGKSGASAFKYLKNNNRCVLFDDNQNKIPKRYKNFKINFKQLKKTTFDYIILSPGININKCNSNNSNEDRNEYSVASTMTISELWQDS